MKLALESVTGNPSSTFREDQVGILADALVPQDMLLIAPAGFGKSMMIEILALLQPEKSIIYVVPLKGLLIDLKERIKKASTLEFDSTLEHQTAQIIFVSVEDVPTQYFKQFLGGLVAVQKISKIVLDEVHLLLTSDFRPKMQQVLEIRGSLLISPPPFLMLSGSLPPHLQQDLCKEISPDCRVVRRSCNVPNITYEVLELQTNQTLFDLNLLRNKKSLIFAMTIKDCEELHAKVKENIPALKYHSNMTLQERTLAVQEWKRGGNEMAMICTPGFGTGIDDGQTTLTIHWKGFWSPINLYQESARGGRKGQPSQSLLITSENLLAQISFLLSKENLKKLKEYKDLRTKCRRQWLLTEVDGKPSLPCFATTWNNCDNCRLDSISTPPLGNFFNQEKIQISKTKNKKQKTKNNNNSQPQTQKQMIVRSQTLQPR